MVQFHLPDDEAICRQSGNNDEITGDRRDVVRHEGPKRLKDPMRFIAATKHICMTYMLSCSYKHFSVVINHVNIL